MQVTTSGTVIQTPHYNHHSCNKYITGAQCFLKGEREITRNPFPVWSLNPSLPSLLEQREKDIEGQIKDLKSDLKLAEDNLNKYLSLILYHY